MLKLLKNKLLVLKLFELMFTNKKLSICVITIMYIKIIWTCGHVLETRHSFDYYHVYWII